MTQEILTEEKAGKIKQVKLQDEGKVLTFFNSQDKQFLSACEKVGLIIRDKNGLITKPATKRQASKWLRHTGLAYKEGR